MNFEEQIDSISSLSEVEQLNKLYYVLDNSFSHPSDEAFKNLQYLMGRVCHLVDKYRSANGINITTFSGVNAFENFDLTKQESEVYWSHKAQKHRVSQFKQSKSDFTFGLNHFLESKKLKTN